MGQQQLLLIVIGVIIVGIAIVASLAVIQSNARQQNEALLIQECLAISNSAQSWVRRPVVLGGPQTQGDYTGLDFSKLGKQVAAGTVIWTNVNGDRYWIIGGGTNNFSLIAYGREGVWVIYFNIGSEQIPTPEIFRSWGTSGLG